MTVDLSTLLTLLILSCMVLGVSTLAVAARTVHSPGLATWGWALIVNAASYLAFGLRLQGWPAASILVSNVLTPLSMALFIMGVVQFHRLLLTVVMRALLWFPVLGGLLVGALLQEQHETRNLINVVMHTWLMLMMAWVAWRSPQGAPRLAGHLLIMAGAIAVAVVFIWRAVLMMGNTQWGPPLFVPLQVQTATYLIVFAALLTNTMGFVLMQMERAIHSQRELATHDPLTGAFNRRELMDVMGRLIGLAQRARQPLGVLMIDIDHFKRVNDTHGHVSGDAVLREVARRLQARLRKSDLLARFGGEEFVVLLPQTSEEEALVVAEGLRATVSATGIPMPAQPDALTVTVSIGVHVRVPGVEPDEADRMIVASDEAMYRAKSMGRNRVEVTLSGVSRQPCGGPAGPA